MESILLDAAGHRRSAATMPGYHRSRPPRNKGEEYPADPPTVEEIVAVMRAVGDRPDGHRGACSRRRRNGLTRPLCSLGRLGLRLDLDLRVVDRPAFRQRNVEGSAREHALGLLARLVE